MKSLKSFVGVRPTTVPCSVLMQLTNNPAAPLFTAHRKVPIIQNLAISTGNNPALTVPIYYGLKLHFEQSSPDQKKLHIAIDQESCKSLNKRQLKFVNSYWGTTASLIKNHVQGVTEVQCKLDTSRDTTFQFESLALDTNSAWKAPKLW